MKNIIQNKKACLHISDGIHNYLNLPHLIDFDRNKTLSLIFYNSIIHIKHYQIVSNIFQVYVNLAFMRITLHLV